MARARRLGLGLLTVASLLGASLAALAGIASASEDYTRILDRPCVACHTSGGVSADLNRRGQVFADVADHRANPQAALAAAEQAYPMAQSSGPDAGFLVPLAVLVLVLGWLAMMLRRRASSRPRGAR